MLAFARSGNWTQWRSTLFFLGVSVWALSEPICAQVTPTPMEAALENLRDRFPNQLVIGFEELWYTRTDREPRVDLGPPKATLLQVLSRIRHDNPNYAIKLSAAGLISVYPTHGTADPAGLLDLRVSEFFLPPDDCLAQQMLYMDSPMAHFSYTPTLSRYLWEHKQAWYKAHGKDEGGVVGDFMGNCEPSNHRREAVYRNITVRDALNLMAVRSLQVAGGRVPTNGPAGFKPKPISWKYRFRRDPDADTGLGGVPLFQAF